MYKWFFIIWVVLHSNDVMHKSLSNYQNTYQNMFLTKKMHKKNIEEDYTSFLFGPLIISKNKSHNAHLMR